MRWVVNCLFGAAAQVAVGAMLVLVTSFQAWLWGVHGRPDAAAIFWISIEALYFASYGVMAVGFGMLWLNKKTPSA